MSVKCQKITTLMNMRQECPWIRSESKYEKEELERKTGRQKKGSSDEETGEMFDV